MLMEEMEERGILKSLRNPAYIPRDSRLALDKRPEVWYSTSMTEKNARPEKPFRVYMDEEGDMLALTEEEAQALHGKGQKTTDDDIKSEGE